MCQKCIDAVKETWPDLPEENYDDLLTGATCFPFGSSEEVRNQLIDIGKKSNYNLEFALEIVWIETTEEMKRCIAREDKEMKIKCREEELKKLKNE